MMDSSEFMMRRLFSAQDLVALVEAAPAFLGVNVPLSDKLRDSTALPTIVPPPATGSTDRLDRALGLSSETTDVEFKSAFNSSDKGEFLEIIKDVLAMANSGGGIILFGLLNDGSPSGAEMKGIATLDPAKVTDLIYKYTDCQFQNFELRRSHKNGDEVWAIIVDSASSPIVFSQTGNYADPSGKQKNAFTGGTVYFRHGAKSEPGNSEDLRQFIERRLESIRHEWLDGISKIVEAPSGSLVQIMPPGTVTASSTPVRLTTSPTAPSLPVGAIDQGWPHRQKDVVVEVNRALAGKKVINSAHILYVRRAHNIETNGEFCYTQKHVSPLYSQAFVDWMVEQFDADSGFFERAKAVADHQRSVATSKLHSVSK
jgi:hypothetical protein